MAVILKAPRMQPARAAQGYFLFSGQQPFVCQVGVVNHGWAMGSTSNTQAQRPACGEHPPQSCIAPDALLPHGRHRGRKAQDLLREPHDPGQVSACATS